MSQSLSVSHYRDPYLAVKGWGEGQRDCMVSMSFNQVCASSCGGHRGDSVANEQRWACAYVHVCLKEERRRMGYLEGGHVVNSRLAPSAYHLPSSSHASDSHHQPPDCCSALIETTLRHACFCLLLAISTSILEGLAHTVVVWTDPNIVNWCNVRLKHIQMFSSPISQKKEAFSHICCDIWLRG